MGVIPYDYLLVEAPDTAFLENERPWVAALGGLIGASTRRPDSARADAILEPDIKDLRLDARPVTDTQLFLEQQLRKLVNGALRGWGTPSQTVNGAAQPQAANAGATLMLCALIGNPQHYPSLWKQYGVYGAPLLTDAAGASVVPNGVLTSWQLPHKALGAPLRVLVNGSAATVTFNTTTNTVTFAAPLAATDVAQVFYQAKASALAAATNAVPLAVAAPTCLNHSSQAGVVRDLVGKISVGSEDARIGRGALISFAQDSDGKLADDVSHQAVPVGNVELPAAKILPLLVVDAASGQLALQCVVRELAALEDDNLFTPGTDAHKRVGLGVLSVER